ncbi:MAG: hypothetical protein K8R54_01415 [Bacteroidales bacterium]|nr:hypothetical protein [Bacteroidales bacterium]
MKRYLLTFILLISFFSGYSQDNEYFDDFKNVFDKEKQENISKIVEKIKEAQAIETKADKLLASKDTTKSLSVIEKASGIYETEYRDLYMLFDEMLTGLSKELEGDKKTYTDNLLQGARNSFRLSIANRLSASEVKEEKLSYELYISAHSNEADAVNMQCRAFAIITGRSNEEITVVNTDYSITENYDNSATENFNVRSFTVENVNLPENFNYNTTDIVYTDLVENGDNKTNNNITPDNVNTYSGEGNEYRIQIGTSIIPANETQINRLNKTDLSVKTYKSKIYYKYTIGSFASFKEAKNYKNAYGLSETYITEYRNNKEVKFYFRDFQ